MANVSVEAVGENVGGFSIGAKSVGITRESPPISTSEANLNVTKGKTVSFNSTTTSNSIIYFAVTSDTSDTDSVTTSLLVTRDVTTNSVDISEFTTSVNVDRDITVNSVDVDVRTTILDNKRQVFSQTIDEDDILVGLFNTTFENIVRRSPSRLLEIDIFGNEREIRVEKTASSRVLDRTITTSQRVLDINESE